MWRRRRRREEQVQRMRTGAAYYPANQENRWLPRALVIRRSAYEGPSGDRGYHDARPVRAVYPRVARTLLRTPLISLPSVRARHDLFRQLPAIPSVPYRLSMSRPDRVRFCLRRKARREVMFAMDVAGKRGVGRGKRWIRNQESEYGCR